MEKFPKFHFQTHQFWTNDAGSSAEKLIQFIVDNNIGVDRKAIFVAHNQARFDGIAKVLKFHSKNATFYTGYYILSAMEKMNVNFDMICIEGRLIEMKMKCRNVVFRDS